MRLEEKKRADEEKRKREEAEQRIRELEALMSSRPITSLDGTSVTLPLSDGIKRDGNVILRTGSDQEDRNCFIGGPMTSV